MLIDNNGHGGGDQPFNGPGMKLVLALAALQSICDSLDEQSGIIREMLDMTLAAIPEDATDVTEKQAAIIASATGHAQTVALVRMTVIGLEKTINTQQEKFISAMMMNVLEANQFCNIPQHVLKLLQRHIES